MKILNHSIRGLLSVMFTMFMAAGGQSTPKRPMSFLCCGALLSLCALAVALWVFPSAAMQEPQASATVVGQVSATATIHCIGIEWPITGDANHDSTCQVEYRRKGTADWRKAMPLLRCHTDRQNCFAGSIFFLAPAMDYEVRLQLADPDGGDETATLDVRTQPVPTLPTGGRTYHVTPGDGGGDGSEATPFMGIRVAEKTAQPGDIFLLHAGDYGVVELTKSGDRDRYIVWKAAADGGAIIRGMSPKSWVWIEGLLFQMKADSPLRSARYIKNGHTTGLAAIEDGASNVCITRCTFRGFHYTMDLAGCNRWYIADNDIQGDNDPITGGSSGEGVELNVSSRNIVAYNRITRVADGISYPGRDCDIYGNDIQDVCDDGIETDRGQINTRVWGNRITNSSNHVFSFQPMTRGPWYFIRNQVVITQGRVWKFTTVNDRFASIHNTFIFPHEASQYAQCVLLSHSRNNLYIRTGDRVPMWRGQYHPRKPGQPGRGFLPDWMTDVDYDGFGWSGMTAPFRWNGKYYEDLGSFVAAVGIEQHGVIVKKEDIFEN